MTKRMVFIVALVGCDVLEPRVSDETVDAPPAARDASLDAYALRHLLSAGAAVPSVADNAELVSQIRIFDGLSDSALANAGGVVLRGTGKAGGSSIKFWSFGSTPVIDGVIASSLLYVLVEADGVTPRTDHPWLVDSIPGDPRYSAIRRVVLVPVTASYGGERMTSIDALTEALELGLVSAPVPAGVWRNMPIVPPGTRLELGGTAPPMEPTEVYGRGHRIDTFPLGVPQPFRNNQIPMGHESRLLSGVAAGTPPALPATPDAQPVFQYGVPAAPPTTSFNYTPVVNALDVRLASGVEPAAITGDGQMFVRAGNGSITAQYTDTVASYVVTTSYTNKQIQFAEGAP